MIVDYEILAAKSGKTLVERINALIQRGEGWQPHGGVTYNTLTSQYAQVVVRVEPSVSMLVGHQLPGEGEVTHG